MKYSLVIAGIVLLVLGAIIIILARQSATLDERIAEFEAKRKIPDSENAAVIYNKLFENYDCNQLELAFTFSKRYPNLRSKPWFRNDYPEVAEWLKNQQDIISELFKATKLEKCYFPYPFEPKSFSKYHRHNIILRNAAVTLTIAANNDIAEGRIEDAIEKDRCMLKISEHIRQQPMFVDYLAGIAFESLALIHLKRIIIETNISLEQSTRIENFPIQIKEAWNEQVAPELLVYEKFFTKQDMKTWSLLNRMKWLFTQGSYEKRVMENIHKFYLRLLTDRRANRILIGLRHFKNQNGKWPESLEQIKPFVDPDVLIDPRNGGSFVYKLNEVGFTLYSRGANNIDEGNRRYDMYLSDDWGQITSNITDDWIIWP